MSFLSDELVLNYHDAVIYGSDLKLLENSTAWLNDACIHFQLTRLQQQHSSGETIFFDPSVISFLMHQCTDKEDYQEFHQGYDFSKSKKMFIPINNGHAASHQRQGAGNHWSLLLVSLGNRRSYWHFDSVRGSNRHAVLVVTNKLEQVFPSKEKVVVRECSTPQQQNGYDCGIHMLVEAEIFASLHDESIGTHEQALKNRLCGDLDFALEARKRIANDIRQLKVEYDRQHIS